MNPFGIGPFHQPHDFLISSWLHFKIYFRHVNDEDRQVFFSFEKAEVGVLKRLKVFRADVLLDFTPPFLDVAYEVWHCPMQVHQQVGFSKRSVEGIEKALEKAILLVIQVVFCKQQSFDKKIVGHHELGKKLPLRQRLLQLLVAFGHEKKLDWKGVALRVFIKMRQERVVGKLLQNKAALKIFLHHLAERRLAGPNVSLNGNERMRERVHIGGGWEIWR